MEKNIIIIGCGGGGSRLSEFLVRDNLKENFLNILYLVDFDIVETKNLQRQFYFQQDVGFKKTAALKYRLQKIDSNLTILTYDLKVTNEESLRIFDKKLLCFCCTDDIESKKAITNYFENYIILSVDRDVVEITINKDYLKTWSFGTGYEVFQDIANNVFSAIIAFKLFKKVVLEDFKLTSNLKININEIFERGMVK